MSDSDHDTVSLGKKWCPTCEPERDPSREILLVQYCTIHEPSREGDADAKIDTSSGFGTHLGTTESDGETNRFFSNALKKIEKDRKA